MLDSLTERRQFDKALDPLDTIRQQGKDFGLIEKDYLTGFGRSVINFRLCSAWCRDIDEGIERASRDASDPFYGFSDEQGT